MKTIAHIAVLVVMNAVALFLANHFIGGFIVSGALQDLFFLALILTILNYTIKPILTFFLGPVIVLTLGVGILAVNALILYILDIISKNLTIETIPALFFATILVGHNGPFRVSQPAARRHVRYA